MGAAFLTVKPVLVQRDGLRQPCHLALGLGSCGFFSGMAIKAGRMGSSRTTGPAQSIARRHPGSGGSFSWKARTEGARPAQEQRLSPESQCYSAHACTDLSALECRILHNMPSITIALTRPAPKKG